MAPSANTIGTGTGADPGAPNSSLPRSTPEGLFHSAAVFSGLNGPICSEGSLAAFKKAMIWLESEMKKRKKGGGKRC